MLETWYDISCKTCHRHVSTDEGTGMSRTKAEIIKWAKLSGWLIKNQHEAYCQICVSKGRHLNNQL